MGLQVGAEPPGGEAERAGARPRDRQGRGPPHQRRAAASQAGAYARARVLRVMTNDVTSTRLIVHHNFIEAQ